MAITPTSKYFVINTAGDNQDFLDFGLSFNGGAISTVGEVIQYNGTSNVDGIFVRPGMTVDAISSGDGSDRIYLTGRFSDYVFQADTADRTLSMSRTVGGQLESAIISGGTATVFDYLIFADGQVSGNALYRAVANNTSKPVPSMVETSISPATLTAQSATIKAFALNQNGDTFATVKPGVNLLISGGAGVDTVYVSDGTQVDATDTGGGNDLIYLRGNWADYSKTVDTVTSNITFTRVVGNNTETVIASSGSGGNHDTLIFADGAAQTNAAKAAIVASATGPASAVAGFDTSIKTPLISDFDIASSLLALQDAAHANNAAGGNGANPVTPLTLGVYTNANVSNALSANVAAYNSALDSSAIDTAQVASTADVQRLVDAYNAILVSADGTAGNTVLALTADQYTAIGVTGLGSGSVAPTSGTALYLLDSVVDATAAGIVGSQSQVQTMADASRAVIAAAAGGTAPTFAQLTALGITGVNAANLADVQLAIAGTADNGTSVDTQPELQKLATIAGGPNLLTNGSFEQNTGAYGVWNSTTLTGWKLDYLVVAVQDGGTNPQGWRPRPTSADGKAHLEISNTEGVSAHIEQTLATPLHAGVSYTLTFKAMALDNTLGSALLSASPAPAWIGLMPKAGGTSFGSVLVDQPSSGNIWATYKITFTPLTDVSSVSLFESANGSQMELAVAIDALSLKQTIPPVVIDMNRDGVLSYSQTAVDLKGDGHLVQTAWAGAQDGILVWDKFGDGSVHNDSQYAFAQYGGATDLQGLAAGFDSNRDGVLDVRDARFAEFAVWQDANQNGASDAGEVQSLTQLGLASINLVSDGVVRTPVAGVTEHGHTTATAADGTKVLVADVEFDFTQPSSAQNHDVTGLANNGVDFAAQLYLEQATVAAGHVVL